MSRLKIKKAALRQQDGNRHESGRKDMIMISQERKNSKQIQRDKIIEYLEKHGSATVRELTVELYINSPTKRISELVKLGYPIKKEWVHRINSRGENKRFIRYVLVKNDGSDQ